MSSKKRWDEVYEERNPFALPQGVVRQLRSCCTDDHEPASLKYLWIYVSESGIRGTDPSSNGTGMLSLEDWLNVVDESASLGTENLIISLGSSLSKHPEVLEICRWAQAAHGMLVGIHAYGAPLTLEEAEALEQLDTDKTLLFLHEGFADEMPFLSDMTLKTLPAEGQKQNVVHPTCDLPLSMACVSASGAMFTCGLVLGQDEFNMGNYFDRKLSRIMADESIPHIVPEGTPKDVRSCDGCPPLMVKRLREELE